MKYTAESLSTAELWQIEEKFRDPGSSIEACTLKGAQAELSLRKTGDPKDNEIESLEGQLRESERDAEDLASQVDSLKSQIEEADDEIGELKSRLEELDTK